MKIVHEYVRKPCSHHDKLPVSTDSRTRNYTQIWVLPEVIGYVKENPRASDCIQLKSVYVSTIYVLMYVTAIFIMMVYWFATCQSRLGYENTNFILSCANNLNR